MMSAVLLRSYLPLLSASIIWPMTNSAGIAGIIVDVFKALPDHTGPVIGEQLHFVALILEHLLQKAKVDGRHHGIRIV